MDTDISKKVVIIGDKKTQTDFYCKLHEKSLPSWACCPELWIHSVNLINNASLKFHMWSIILPDGKHDCLETYLRQPEIVLFLVDLASPNLDTCRSYLNANTFKIGDGA